MDAPIKQPITAQDLTAAAFKSVESRMKVMAKTGDMVNSSLARIGSALTIGAIVGVGRSFLNAADNINDMSDRLGISTEALSQYQHVAKMSGTDFESLANGIKFAQKAVSEAAAGSREASDALTGLGLDVQKLHEMSPEAAFEAIGDAISKLPSAADRTAISMKLFGRSGTDLIPVFKDGAAGVRTMREEADRLGLTLDDLSAKKAARANDAIDRMTAAFQGLGRELAIGAGPAIEKAASKLGSMVAEVSLELDWKVARKESQAADLVIQEAFADAWRAGGKRGAVEYWQAYKTESAKVAASGLFARDVALFPGMTPGGAEAAAAYRVRAVPEILNGLESIEVATDGLTESEARYFQALERSVQAAQVRSSEAAHQDWLVSQLMDTDDQMREKEAKALANHNREVQAAIDEYEQLRRESDLTWQMMTQGLDMVTDQLSNNLAAAIAGARVKLIDLANVAESLLSMAFRYAIVAGIGALTGGIGGLTGAGPGAGIPGVMPVPGIPLKAISGIPGPKSGGTTIQSLNVNVTGKIDPNDRLSIRRVTTAIYDDLQRIQKHHGPMGVPA